VERITRQDLIDEEVARRVAETGWLDTLTFDG